MRREWIAAAIFGLLVAPLGIPSATAQSGAGSSPYPDKPIRVIVPFPPGGSSDAMMRMIAPLLGERLKQQVVVENRPGAGGNIGLAAVAKSPNDGYTLGLGAAGGLSANVHLYPSMPYDATKDFSPISLLAGIPFVLVGAPNQSAQTMVQLLAQMRSQTAPVSIGHGGNGTAMHLSIGLMEQLAKLKVVSVAYRGSGPAATDAMGGQIPLAVVDLPSALQNIQSGRLRAFAVTSAQRLASLPQTPTLAEAGLTGYESVGWFGLVAPAGTPKEIVQKINTELLSILADAKVQSSLRQLGIEPSVGTPQAFESFIKTETVKWGRVIKESAIKLD